MERYRARRRVRQEAAKGLRSLASVGAIVHRDESNVLWTPGAKAPATTFGIAESSASQGAPLTVKLTSQA